MLSVFTALFIIRILLIRLNKLAKFDLNVKQKQSKATEVSELNLAYLTEYVCWTVHF